MQAESACPSTDGDMVLGFEDDERYEFEGFG